MDHLKGNIFKVKILYHMVSILILDITTSCGLIGGQLLQQILLGFHMIIQA